MQVGMPKRQHNGAQQQNKSIRFWTRGRVPSCCWTRRENKHHERTEENSNMRAWRQETLKQMNKGMSHSRLYSFLDVLGAGSRKTLGIVARAPLAILACSRLGQPKRQHSQMHVCTSTPKRQHNVAQQCNTSIKEN